MRTLVLNLTRFGDLLQTQPVISGLRARGETVSLACLDIFAGAAALLRDVDEVIPLPGARIMARLDQAWPLALAEVSTWLERGRSQVDRVVNLTPTLSARLLSQALRIPDSQGFCLDEHGFGLYSTPWAAFLQAASVHRGCSPFNLVDLFQRVAGLEPGSMNLREPSTEALAAADALLDNATEGMIALQLGASQDYRRWPVEAFVRAGRMVWTATGHRAVLLGTAGESQLAREFTALADFPCTDLTGRTDLQVLAAVLRRMRLLLTNDTGTMHLAAGLGVPVVAVFLGTAQPFDTGPYLEGAVSLEPDLPCHPCSFGERCPHGLICRDRIDGTAVGGLIAGLLQEHKSAPAGAHGARIWQAKRDASGFMDLFSLSGHDEADRTQWIRVQREIYRQFLDQTTLRAVQSPSWPDSPFREALTRELQQASMLLTLVEEQGRLMLVRPDTPVRQKFLLNCQKVQDTLKQSSTLGVLGPLWQYQAGEQSADLRAFLALCAAYRGVLSVFLDAVGVA